MWTKIASLVGTGMMCLAYTLFAAVKADSTVKQAKQLHKDDEAEEENLEETEE